MQTLNLWLAVRRIRSCVAVISEMRNQSSAEKPDREIYNSNASTNSPLLLTTMPYSLLHGWSIFFLAVLYLSHPFILLLFRQYRTPLRRLPRPPSPSFFMGNLSEMHDMENTGLVERWERALGRSWVYRGFFGGCRCVSFLPY